MYNRNGAQQRVEDRAEIMLHKGASSSSGGVYEKQHTIVRRQLDQPVMEQRSTFEMKHLCILIGIRWGNVALDYGNIHTTRWYDRSWRRGQELGIKLIVWNCHGAIKNFACEVFVAADCGARGGGWRFGKIGKRETPRYSMKNINPGGLDQRLIMYGSDNLGEEMTGGRWARQSVRKDFDRAHRLEG